MESCVEGADFDSIVAALEAKALSVVCENDLPLDGAARLASKNLRVVKQEKVVVFDEFSCVAQTLSAEEIDYNNARYIAWVIAKVDQWKRAERESRLPPRGLGGYSSDFGHRVNTEDLFAGESGNVTDGGMAWGQGVRSKIPIGTSKPTDHIKDRTSKSQSGP